VNLLPTLLALLVCTIAAIGSSRNLNRTYARLEGEIRSQDDLLIVREVINLSMLQAFILIMAEAFWVIGFLIAIYFGFLRRGDILIHGGTFAGGLTLIVAYAKPIEKRFRGLKANPLKPEIGETFARWKKEWREPRIRLSE